MGVRGWPDNVFTKSKESCKGKKKKKKQKTARHGPAFFYPNNLYALNSTVQLHKVVNPDTFPSRSARFRPCMVTLCPFPLNS